MLHETTTVPVKVNVEELKVIQEHAERQGMSVDALLRFKKNICLYGLKN